MSGHAEDPVSEESKRFFTFFNLSMILVAITGIEIVIIYVETFEGSSIISVLFATSILKFVGVVWWFMHLRWDKILNTMLFLLGLVIALGTFFAVIYMADTHPVIAEDGFSVNPLQDKWESGKNYLKGDYVLQGESYFDLISITRRLLLSPSKLTRERAWKILGPKWQASLIFSNGKFHTVIRSRLIHRIRKPILPSIRTCRRRKH